MDDYIGAGRTHETIYKDNYMIDVKMEYLYAHLKF